MNVSTFRAAFSGAAEAVKGSGAAAFEKALGLYGGDLLAEDPYEDWIAERREALRLKRQDLLARLASRRGAREPARRPRPRRRAPRGRGGAAHGRGAVAFLDHARPTGRRARVARKITRARRGGAGLPRPCVRRLARARAPSRATKAISRGARTALRAPTPGVTKTTTAAPASIGRPLPLAQLDGARECLAGLFGRAPVPQGDVPGTRPRRGPEVVRLPARAGLDGGHAVGGGETD